MVVKCSEKAKHEIVETFINKRLVLRRAINPVNNREESLWQKKK